MHVIIIDWSALALWWYYNTSKGNIKYVARAIHKFIEELMRILEISAIEKGRQEFLLGILMIGHSLGAHLAGLVGYLFVTEYKASFYLDREMIGIIVGLDPAGVAFSPTSERHFLTWHDARKVLILHACAISFGTTYKTGHEDYFLNGGLMAVSIAPVLSHMRVLNIIHEIAASKNLFAEGYLCTLPNKKITGAVSIAQLRRKEFDMFTEPNRHTSTTIIPYPIYMVISINAPYIQKTANEIPSYIQLSLNGWTKILFSNVLHGKIDTRS